MAVTTGGGHIIVSKGGVKQFGTDTPFVNLFLDKRVVVTVPVVFPEFPKDWIYGFSRDVIGIPEGFDLVNYSVGYALILSKIMPQEWNASQVIGSVPALCNYIDVRAYLAWTKQPSLTAGSPVRSPLHIGGQVHLQGGSGVLEIGNGFRRAIHVGLSGASIVLTRYQSSRSLQPTSYAPWGGPTQVGWSYLSSPYGTVQNKIGENVQGAKYPNGLWTPPYRGGPTDPGINLGWDDHSSNWSIQFIITPGRVNASV